MKSEESTSHQDLSSQPVNKKSVKPEILNKLLRSSVVNSSHETPIVTLNSLVERESYFLQIKEEGNKFEATVRIDGKIFVALEKSKRKARDSAAILALRHVFSEELIPLFREDFEKVSISNNISTPAAADIHDKFRSSVSPLDFPFADAKNPPNPEVSKVCAGNGLTLSINESCSDTKKRRASVSSNGSISNVKKKIKLDVARRILQNAFGIVKCDNVNPVSALYNLCDSSAFQFDVTNVGAEFVAKLNVDGTVYLSTASSIKKAKNNAAKQALCEIFSDLMDSIQNEQPLPNTNNNNNDYLCSHPAGEYEPSNPLVYRKYHFTDFVAFTIQNKFNEITATHPDHLQKYSILAGIVMVKDYDLSSTRVIAISTGNKCLQGDRVTTDGNVVLDCHAEILSRRCLILYMYSELKSCLTGSKETIFEETGEKNRYRLKSNIEFYLYISSAPCGDGRVFTFNPSDKNSTSAKADAKRGILRVKLESGMGGIPVSQYAELTSVHKGYLQGKPLVVMCCSAKLLRANILGVQGALLSHFLDPVYLAGVLIGDVFDKENVKRALYGRVSSLDLSKSSRPFRIHKPVIEGSSESQVLIHSKPGKSCMNWIATDPVVEYINTKTGKTIEGNVSRLCKYSLYEKFIDVLFHSFRLSVPESYRTTSYIAYKESAVPYQKTKKLLFDYLEGSGYGKWVRKPRELNEFTLGAKEELPLQDPLLKVGN